MRRARDQKSEMETVAHTHAPHALVYRHHPRRISRPRAWMAFYSLLLATAICLTLIFMRHLFAGYASYSFLIWNLMLAWIPLLFSFLTYRFHALGTGRGPAFFFCAFAWFVFFPNAPYIATDIVHISPIHIAPAWLDMITVIACAWTGLCLGYLSLYLMQEIARDRMGRLAGWAFVLVMLALGSLGVYCGRFLRWNSWDVLSHPIWMLHTAHPIHRFSQPGGVIFLITFFLFLLLSYCSLFAFTHLYDRSEYQAVPATR